jgi:hypothetical protein
MDSHEVNPKEAFTNEPAKCKLRASHSKKPLDKNEDFFMVLKQYHCANDQPSNNNMMSKHKLINNRFTNIHNPTSIKSSNSHPENKIRVSPSNSRSSDCNNTTPLRIYHQNIRGVRNKIEELLMPWSSNFPHFLCLTEHHLGNDEINSLYIDSFNLGAKYCRVTHS